MQPVTDAEFWDNIRANGDNDVIDMAGSVPGLQVEPVTVLTTEDNGIRSYHIPIEVSLAEADELMNTGRFWLTFIGRVPIFQIATEAELNSHGET